MKKTLAAVAILGAFAGSAMADVTVYGRIDTGLLYTDNGETETLEMSNGLSTGGRWGLKGSTEIAEGVKAGFVLESRVYGDDGDMPDNVKMFDREAVIYVAGPYGTVYAGRINSFWSDGGSVAMFSNYAAFGTGSAVGQGTGMFVTHSRQDNTLTYVSPAMAGVKVYAQYAMGGDTKYDVDEGKFYAGEDVVENEATTDRKYSIGAEYKAGDLGVAFVYTYKNEKSVGVANVDDEMTVNLAASYNFGVAKAKVAAQYFKDANKVFKLSATEGDLEGFALNVGADVPAFGGTFTVGGTYVEAERADDASTDMDGYNVAVQYVYPFSKQVQVYAGIGYTDYTVSDKDADETKAMAGMVVRF